MKYLLWLILVIFSIMILDLCVFCSTNRSLSERVFYAHHYGAITFPVNSYIHPTPEYNQKVHAGYDTAKNKTIVICALARNIMSSLPLNQTRLELWGQIFKDYRIVIYENDSTDGTREALLQWQSNNSKVYVLPCGLSVDPVQDCKYKEKVLYDFGFNSQARMSKMANMRNLYLNYVKTHYAHFDYMMVYDIDISGPMNNDGMMIPFAEEHQWDAICANGISPIPGLCGMVNSHYDLVAFIDLEDPYDINKNLNGVDVITGPYIRMLFNKGLNVDRSLYPVKSAFGGATIYKIPSILPKSVQYNSDYGCEHISFHKLMADNGAGRIFINPSGVILVGRQGPDILNVILNK